jgi:hypothetical protein
VRPLISGSSVTASERFDCKGEDNQKLQKTNCSVVVEYKSHHQCSIFSGSLEVESDSLLSPVESGLGAVSVDKKKYIQHIYDRRKKKLTCKTCEKRTPRWPSKIVLSKRHIVFYKRQIVLFRQVSSQQKDGWTEPDTVSRGKFKGVLERLAQGLGLCMVIAYNSTSVKPKTWHFNMTSVQGSSQIVLSRQVSSVYGASPHSHVLLYIITSITSSCTLQIGLYSCLTAIY